MEECGAPVVSIAGGEPLLHPDIATMVDELVARKRFVYLCTNAVLLRRKLDMFTPSPYFAFTVHIDGLRERHDEAVDRPGVFDEAVAAIREAKARGFRVTTNSTFFTNDSPETVRSVLDFLNDELEVDSMMISPAYAYEKAPDQEHFLGVEQTRRLFRATFADGRRRRWRLNHSPLFLDFLEGKVDYQCTAWGIPSYSVFGWQRPCYLMADGYTSTYRELVEDDRLGPLRTGQGSSLRQLHGPLRLRADRSRRHDVVAAGSQSGPCASPPDARFPRSCQLDRPNRVESRDMKRADHSVLRVAVGSSGIGASAITSVS